MELMIFTVVTLCIYYRPNLKKIGQTVIQPLGKTNFSAAVDTFKWFKKVKRVKVFKWFMESAT